MVTGLRRSDLQALQPEDFDLDGKPPVFTVEGEHTKRSRPTSRSSPADRNSSLMLKADLLDADVLSDHDFVHELRHRSTTGVVQTGASVKEAMELASHADLTMGRYAHAPLEEESGRVVDNLPTLPVGNVWAQVGSYDSAHILPTNGVSGGPNGTTEDQGDSRPFAS